MRIEQAGMSRRAQQSGDQWTEIFVNRSEAEESANAASSVINGDSIFVIHGLATPDECKLLRGEAMNYKPEISFDPIAELQAASKLVRRPVIDMCGEEGQALCDQLLIRAISSVPVSLPNLVLGKKLTESLTADEVSMSIMDHTEVCFSDGEPAINVYSVDGAFRPHKDQEALTVLLNLSEEKAYAGGGTGFWSVADSTRGRSREDPAGRLGPDTWAPPTVVIRPPVGSALVFVGTVMHGGLRVTSGVRCTLVSSFSPKERKAARTSPEVS